MLFLASKSHSCRPALSDSLFPTTLHHDESLFPEKPIHT
jgi:hypothetical protein